MNKLHIKPTLVILAMILSLAAAVAAPSSARADASGITRTPWEMNRGGSWSFLGLTLPYHGEIRAYNNASIPGTADPNWGPAPNTETIGFSERSILPGYCLQAADYTYFQTFVTVSPESTVTQFNISFSGIDDGGRVSVFNATYPNGLIVPGSYVYLGGSGTSNLASYITTGVNRIVVTQVDDCPVGNNLITGLVVLNGITIPSNAAPTAVAGDSYGGDEGSDIAIDGSGSSDPDNDSLTYAWSYSDGAGVDPGASCTFGDAAAVTTTINCTDDGSYDLTLTVDDGNGAQDSNTTTVEVANVAPTVGLVSVPTDPIDTLNQPVSGVSAPYTDPGTADTHTCTVDFGDLSEPQVGTAAAGICTGPGHTYLQPGVYTVTVEVEDDDSGTDSATATSYIVIYDTSAGFVTGGGWIDSPAGAFTADGSATGKASFGFVAKYRKGATAPSGNTQFQFKAGDLNFHSTSYEWLVVAGNKAQFKGEGTINGEGSYKFMLSADDDSPDTFRMQIMGIYDNGSNQALGGGSIKVHSK